MDAAYNATVAATVLAVGRSAAVNTDFLRFEKSIDCLKYTYD
jgi:hypothetical protein